MIFGVENALPVKIHPLMFSVSNLIVMYRLGWRAQNCIKVSGKRLFLGHSTNFVAKDTEWYINHFQIEGNTK